MHNNKYSPELIATASKTLKPGTVARQQMERGLKNADPVILMVDGLFRYQQDYLKRFETPLADDYFLGKEWFKSWHSVRQLLNGDGQFDAGVLDQHLMLAAEQAGFDTSAL